VSSYPEYEAFLRAKMVAAPERGISIDAEAVNPLLKPHQAAIVRWAVRKGNAAIFAAFGLGKTFMQLEILRLILAHAGGKGLIVAPLGVRQEFMRDAAKLDIVIKFVRRFEECEGDGLYLTNYETVRDSKLDPRAFTVCSLDEAAILRGFGGTKTFREFMRVFENGQVQYKFVATATPSPNEYIELLAYAAFLDVMDVSQAKTRFFKRDSTQADNLTLHPHKEREFWLWQNSYATFLQSPEDMGFDGSEYVLPELTVLWHELPSDHSNSGHETSGQGRLLRNSRIGVTHAAREKKDSIAVRVQKMQELVSALAPDEQFIVWCDRNDEQRAVDRALQEMGISVSSLYGSQSVDEREGLLDAWKLRQTRAFVTKAVMYGAGVNLQQCAIAIFIGIDFKFAAFLQAVKRIHRFLQTKPVTVHLIYTEAERAIREDLQEKWDNHNKLVENMSQIIREYGLARNAMQEEFGRSLGVERTEASGLTWKLAHNDAVLETCDMPESSVHLILTSIPFSTQYEYSPSYNDFGHSETNEQFWEQMGFVIPELYRILCAGRVAAIHVKDRNVPGGLSGMGFQTVYEFHCDAVRHFKRAGFAYLGMVTIVTDVVRENNQTYRLGWTEQCKDGTKMGVGMPEYLLLFRKPPSDSSNGYADVPVIKNKAEYSRSRWQVDAHGFHRSDGNRLLSSEELRGLDHKMIFRRYRDESRTQVYDFERHVKLGEVLEVCAHCSHIHIGVKMDDDEGKVCGVDLGHKAPYCPVCKSPLKMVTQPSDSPLNRDQWESQIAGNWFCDCHNNHRGNKPYAFFWDSEFQNEICKCPRYDSALPKKFMLLQPQSWHPDVWTDVTRMRSLNSAQSAAGRQLHLCPMQFDIAKRAITQYTMPGEVVFDPFVGIGTVAEQAVRLGRIGRGVELSADYFRDAVYYCEKAEAEASVPTLFDMSEPENEEEKIEDVPA
jgi:DNA modification methylase/superfamily II DNA or RNA helicase